MICYTSDLTEMIHAVIKLMQFLYFSSGLPGGVHFFPSIYFIENRLLWLLFQKQLLLAGIFLLSRKHTYNQVPGVYVTDMYHGTAACYHSG